MSLLSSANLSSKAPGLEEHRLEQLSFDSLESFRLVGNENAEGPAGTEDAEDELAEEGGRALGPL